jgi:hypothetical protein
VVYIREAHALDGGSPKGGDGAPLVEEPATLDERKQIARTCSAKLDLAPLRTLIDDMEDTTSTAYAAFPDRLYLVGADGNIAFAGDKGPRGFSPDELEDAVRVALELPPLERDQRREKRRRRP